MCMRRPASGRVDSRLAFVHRVGSAWVVAQGHRRRGLKQPESQTMASRTIAHSLRRLRSTAPGHSPRTAALQFRWVTGSQSLPVKLNDPTLFRQKAFVNGQWVDSNTSRVFSVDNPADGQEIGQCPDMDLKDLELVIQAATTAFSTYKVTTPNQRREWLLEFDRLIKANAQDLTRLIVSENGKSWKDASAEVTYAASFVDWFAQEAIRTYGDIIPSSTQGIRHLVIRQPIGVVAALCPWNFPAAMITRKIAPALATGCSVIVKAPSETPFTALALADLAQRAGFPDGVLNVVTTHSSTPEIGKELCENDEIRKLSFTGSTEVGKLLMKQSASSLKKLSFELGGNSPFIVFEDADIDQAVNGAIACKFRCSGQTCVSANRIFVHSSIYAEFASKLARKISEMKIGSGFETGVSLGPLINQKSLEKVDRHVQNAKAQGAEVLIGGRRSNVSEHGLFYEPTVLSEVPAGAIDHEETFGPVAALYRFEDENEVLKLANQAEVGLAGYFYSRDLSRIWRVAEAMEVGMVGVNTGMVSNATTPFGGVKHSGFGREGSRYGIEEYQIIKYIALGGL